MLEVADISDIELKQRWRLYWIHCLFEFANPNLQRMAWIDPEQASWPDEVWDSSFESCNDAYFEHLDLYDLYETALTQGNVSAEEVEHVKDFHNKALGYIEPDDNPEAILSDPQWIEVTQAAKTFWKYLKETVSSDREIELMNKLEREFPL